MTDLGNVKAEILGKYLLYIGGSCMKSILCIMNQLGLCFSMFIWTGRYPNAEVEILPLDVMSDEEILREAVKKAESFFSSAGVYYMVHNAGDDPPVCIL